MPFRWYFILVTALLSIAQAQDSLEKKLIADWEQIQRSDPKIETLEKTGEETYLFSTRYFRFNGEMRLLNVIIEPNNFDTLFPLDGTVEVDLVGMTSDSIEKYHASYLHWARLNHLKYNCTTRQWITLQEYSRIQREMHESFLPPKPPVIEYIRQYIFYIVLLIIVMALLAFMHSVKGNLELLRILLKGNNDLLKQIILMLKRDKNDESDPPQ